MATSHVADRELVGQLFKLNYDWLRARVRARLGCPYDADDIAAETFARVLALQDPSAVREPRALLTTIAQHLIYEGWRRRDLEKAYLRALHNVPEQQQPAPEEHLILIESLLAIDKLLDGLSSQGKAVFVLSQLEGLTYTSIGERLGLSLGSVHRHMSDALRCCYRVFGA